MTRKKRPERRNFSLKLRSSHEVRCYRRDVRFTKTYGKLWSLTASARQRYGETYVSRTEIWLNESRSCGCSCAEGGPEDQLKAADPRDEFLGPFDARLESCACRGRRSQCTANYQCIIASKRRGVHGMYGEFSSRRTLMRFNLCQVSAAEIIAAPPALK